MHGNKGDLNIVGKVYVTTYRLGGMSYFMSISFNYPQKKEKRYMLKTEISFTLKYI